MQEYLLNAIYWWFGIRVRKTWINTGIKYIFILLKTDTIPMAKNFTVPLYRDKSFGGRVISIFIRFWWIFIGNIISLFYIVPFVSWAIFVTTLPFLALIQVIQIITS